MKQKPKLLSGGLTHRFIQVIPLVWNGMEITTWSCGGCHYVVPNELYPKIKDLVPNDIGIIAYYPEKNNYRIKKECEFKEISHELKERLLYDAFKKWIDKFHYEYFHSWHLYI